MNQKDFVTTFGPLADDIAGATGLDRSVVLGVVAQETGWGDHYTGHNLFGISPGGRVASYGSIPEGAQAFVDLVKNRYYSAVNSPPEEQPYRLAAAGYNPYSNYGPSVAAHAKTVQKIADDASAPSADDLQKRMDRITTRGAATQPAESDTPSADDLQKRMDQIAPPPPQQAPPVDRFAHDPPPDTQHSNEPPERADGTTPTGPRYRLGSDGQMVPVKDVPQDQGPQPSSGLPRADLPAIGTAATEAFRSTPSFLSPDTKAWLAQHGLLGRLGNALAEDVGGTVTGTGPIWAGINALYRGGQEATRQVLASELPPGLAETIVQAPDAFAGSPHMLMPPAGAEAPTGWKGPPLRPGGAGIVPDFDPMAARVADVRAALDAPRAPATVPTLGNITDAIRRADLMRADEVGAAIRRDQSAEAPVASQPAGGAAGADVTTAPIPERTEAQRIADLEKQQATKAHERANAQGKDTNRYIDDPDVKPVAAAIDPQDKVKIGDQEIRVADAHQALMNSDGQYEAFVKARQREASDVMSRKVRDMAGDGNLVEQEEQARGQLGDQMRDAAMKDAKPVDVQPLVDHIDDVLSQGGNKDPAVTSAMNDIKERLYKDNAPTVGGKPGVLESDPNVLYSLRLAISKELSSKGMAANPKMGLARKEVSEFLTQLDERIEKGAPGYRAYMDAYAEASKHIDQMRALQNFTSGSRSIFNPTSGLVELKRVEAAITSIIKDKKAKGLNPAKHITDEQMQTLFTIRDHLARDQALREAAAPAGSPTAKLMTNIAKVGRPVPVESVTSAGVKEAGNALLHYGLLHATGGVGNMLMLGGKAVGRMREARHAGIATKEAAEIEAQKEALKQRLMSDHPEYGAPP